MTLNLYRIYSEPCGSMICTVACEGDAEAALELAKCNAWVCQQMTGDACAFPCEEVGEW